ncbi:MAG: AAA family ATPase, partial [Desulfobacterales bacterium]|nr:AAA family ATPase [Desulfobacterales bacterium]
MIDVDAVNQTIFLEFDQPDHALRFFAMVREKNSEWIDWSGKWSVNAEALARENREAERMVRKTAGAATKDAASDAGTPRPLSPPYVVTRLDLQDFRCFKHLLLDFNRESSLPGSWICLAGVNGAGKSSILQAVCLALLGYKAAQELGVELLNRMRRRADGRTRNAKIGVW